MDISQEQTIWKAQQGTETHKVMLISVSLLRITLFYPEERRPSFTLKNTEKIPGNHQAADLTAIQQVVNFPWWSQGKTGSGFNFRFSEGLLSGFR